MAQLYETLRPHMDERQRRLLLGAEAARLGRGGVKAVASVTGAHPATVARGAREASGAPEPRTRAAGGGRKPLTETDPELGPALMALVEPESRGDPESPLRWTCLSTRNLADTLTAAGHRCSAPTAARLLKSEGYSLQGNAKVAEGRQHPDRDAQFRYIARTAREHLDAGQPVVSVDAKKKEKVGEFANGGAEWRPKGHPERVNVHDFPSDAIGKAIPYGIYDLGANAGWVSVGTDHDTSAFAAATLRRWWRADGSARYPEARLLLICADSGGSNAARARAWKVELARLAAETGLEITCCHYPPGTSKWNKVEHRLFAQITRNWRGRPLTSHQAVVELISATTTSTGLTVTAELDASEYPTGLTYTKKQVEALPIDYHGFHGDWNYTIRPEPHETPIPTRKQTTRPRKSKLFIFDRLVGRAAAADVVDGVGREAHPVRGEEGDQLGDLLGAADRFIGIRLVMDASTSGAVPSFIGVGDNGRGDGVDQHAGGSQLLARRLGQADHRGLGRRVNGQVGVRKVVGLIPIEAALTPQGDVQIRTQMGQRAHLRER